MAKVVRQFSQLFNVFDDGSIETEYTPQIDIFPLDPEEPPEKPPGDYLPKLADEAGLRENKFFCGFNAPDRIDLVGKPISGKTQFTISKRGNIFRAKQVPAKNFSFHDGVLSQSAGVGGYNLSLISTWPTGGNQWDGFALQGLEKQGWYIEARVRHADQAEAHGIFAIWTMDARHLYGVKGAYEFVEFDSIEYWPFRNATFGAGDPIFSTHLHFHGTNGQADLKANPPRKRQMETTVNPSDHDPRKWFVVGHRVVPIGPETIRVEHFIDGQRVAIKEMPWRKAAEAGFHPILLGGKPEFDIDYIGAWA